MIKKASIFTLNAYTAQGAADVLKARLSEHCGELREADFSAPLELARAAVSCGGLAVAAAPISQYLDAKLRIIKELQLRPVRSKAIVDALALSGIGDQRTRDLHSAVPEGAKALPTEDGRYSGFICKHGNGMLILLPLDADIVENCFNKELRTVFGEAKPKHSTMAQFRQSVERIIAVDRPIAVAQVGCFKPLLASLMSVDGASEIFLPCKLGDEINGNDYYAECAKAAKTAAQTDFGIAVSDIETDSSGTRFMTVCVADGKSAKCAKVFADGEESDKHLASAAIVKLCSMLDELDNESELNPPPELLKKPANSRKPFIIALAGIGAAILLCVILTVVLGSGSGKALFADDTAAGSVTQQSETYNYGGNIYDYHGEVGIGDEDDETTEPSTVQNSVFTLPVTARTLTTKLAATAATVKTTVKNIATTIAATVKQTEKPTQPSSAKPTEQITEKPTEKPTEAKTTSKKSSSNGDGKFVFKVYGWGHGVGMSQQGAIQMAKDGSSYKQILAHYYPGTTLKTDSNTPKTVIYGGEEIPIVKYLCGTTKREIGAGSPVEALKAQLVCAYSFAKTYNFNVPASQHAYDDGYAYEGTALHKACLEVLNMSSDSDTPKAVYVDYNGSAARTVYFDSVGGKTASAADTWGATQYPYLSGGASCKEEVRSTTVEISAADMKKYILNYNEDIKLDDDPANWLEIISHDGARSENCGYVIKIRVGDKTVSGNNFRAKVLKYKIRSHCFTVEYVPA